MGVFGRIRQPWPEMQLRGNCKFVWEQKKLPSSSHNQAMTSEDITD
jgi:hypothetical protein